MFSRNKFTSLTGSAGGANLPHHLWRWRQAYLNTCEHQSWHLNDQRQLSGWMASLLVALGIMLLTSAPVNAQVASFTEMDFGYPGATGTYSFSAGTPPTYTTQGAGTGFGSQDHLSFDFVPTTGNIEIEGRVSSIGSANASSVAGFMIRGSLAFNGPEASIGVTSSNGVSFFYRDQYGNMNTVNGSGSTAPVYLRLTRSGNTISGFESPDGLSWTLVGSYTETTALPSLFYVGFMNSSYVNSTLNTAVFDYVTYMTSVPQAGGSLIQWIRDDQGITASSGAISTWADQSGSGNNATQSTSSLQPTLTTGALNSGVLPSISFNGSSQYLSCPSGFADLTHGVTLAMVIEPTSSSATGNPCSFGNSSNSDAVFAQTTGTNALLEANNGSTTSSVTTTSNPLSTSSYHLLEEVLLPGATAGTALGTIYVDGVQKAQATNLQNLNNTTRSTNLIGAAIGLANYFQGNIGELLVFSSALSDADRHALESYIYSKFRVGNEPTLDPPTFSLQSGAIITPMTSISLAQDENRLIYHTEDGSTPVAGTSQWYDGVPIPINQTTTINAIADAPFFNDSSVASATYTVDSTTSPISRDGLVGWYRADAGVTTSGGSAVSQWFDVSGAGDSATQTNSSNRPTLVANAVNGFPAVSFNSSSSQFLQFPINTSSFNGISMFALVKPAYTTSGATLLDLDSGSYDVSFSEPTSTGLSFTAGGDADTGSSAVTSNQFQLLELVQTIVPHTPYPIVTTTMLTNASPDTLSGTEGEVSIIMNGSNNFIGQASGGGNFFNGQITELLIYNRGVSEAEQASIESYLLNKYQAPLLTVPAPVISVPTSTLTAPQAVAIAAPSNAQTFITVDGSTPSTSSIPYVSPVPILFSQTLKAINVIDGVSSSVSTATYTLDSTQWPAPNSGDSTPLQTDLQLPTNAIP